MKIEPTILCGGADNSIVLQKVYDQCLSDGLYVEVNDSKIKQIVRKILNIGPGQTIIISAPLYLLALLKTNSAPLILQSGGTQLIVSNFRAFLSKSLGTVLFAKLATVASGAIIWASFPLILTALIYAELHINCDSFVSPLPSMNGNLQYIETVNNKDGKVIVAPSRPNPMLYHALDETEVSTSTSLSCFIKDNCLGTESIQRKNHFKPKRMVPLNQRTKTLKDLDSQVDVIDEITVNNVNYKEKTNRVINDPLA